MSSQTKNDYALDADSVRSLARDALKHWPIEVATLELIKHRENAVFGVVTPDGDRFALRIHRPGYHSAAELQSELLWMQSLDTAGIRTPTVIANADGRLFHQLQSNDGSSEILCDLLAWVEGDQLGTIEEGIAQNSATVENTFQTIGCTAARLHNHAQRWSPPAGFTRRQ